ncbi:hypothetical protein B6C83_03665 [Aerococcus urinae]|nr:hypothetical protein B6C83_03665 [Aerococcus urinae]RAV66605.1 hypothetical protein DBT42_04830 [Aerococcus urinae]
MDACLAPGARLKECDKRKKRGDHWKKWSSPRAWNRFKKSAMITSKDENTGENWNKLSGTERYQLFEVDVRPVTSARLKECDGCAKGRKR